MRSLVCSTALLLLSACSSSGADGEAGFETGPCVEGGCFDGLQCLSDLCVEGEDVDDDDGGPGGGFVGPGASDSATSQAMTGESGASATTPETATSPTSLTTNASQEVTSNAESPESGDDLPPDDDSTTGFTTGGGDCGNGNVDPGEQCDGNDVGGFDCTSLGLGEGEIDCDPITCSFDTSMCVPTTSATSSG